MDERPRLTVEQIKADIAKTGLELVCDVWFEGVEYDEDGNRRIGAVCGCPMAIHYAAAIVDDEAWFGPVAEAWCSKKFGSDYVTSFTYGFDMGFADPEDITSAEGFADGIAARKALLFAPVEEENSDVA